MAKRKDIFYVVRAFALDSSFDLTPNPSPARRGEKTDQDEDL
jgi:hypothetical protein